MKVHVADHHRSIRIVVAVMEGNMVKYDIPFEDAGINSTFFILFQREIHDLFKPLYTAHSFHDLLIRIDQPFQRRQKHGNIQQVCHKIATADLAVEKHPSAD